MDSKFYALRLAVRRGCNSIQVMIRLLFIDDDPKAQQTLSLVLEEEYKVYSAYTGLSGIELIKEIHPDVVLLDINLPDIDGLEVLEKINNSSQAPPTIMLTAP